MTERKEEADPERLAAGLQQQAHGIVDGRDMVGIEGVPQAEQISDQAQADQLRMLARKMEI